MLAVRPYDDDLLVLARPTVGERARGPTTFRRHRSAVRQRERIRAAVALARIADARPTSPEVHRAAIVVDEAALAVADVGRSRQRLEQSLKGHGDRGKHRAGCQCGIGHADSPNRYRNGSELNS